MDIGFVVNLVRGGVSQAMLIASPVLIIALVIGLLISIFQATTSIQDQTLTFVPKILAILITIGLLGSWMFARMEQYTLNLFSLIPEMAG